MRRGNVGKAGFAREFDKFCFMGGIAVPMHQDDGDRNDALRRDGAQLGEGLRPVDRAYDIAVRGESARNLDNPFVEHFGQANVPCENIRPVLITDTQGIGEAAVDDQSRSFTTALEKRICGDGRAHFYGFYLRTRQVSVGGNTKDFANALECGIRVAFGRL